MGERQVENYLSWNIKLLGEGREILLSLLDAMKSSCLWIFPGSFFKVA